MGSVIQVEGLRLVRSRDRATIVAVARLALGLAAFAIASTRVAGDRAVLGVALGALGFGVVGTARQLELGRAKVEEGWPARAIVVAPFHGMVGALLPSTIGVFALALAATALEPLIAPVLAGILIGMAIATGAGAGQLSSAERLRHTRIYQTVDPPVRAFAVAADQPL
jgi:hypothetical protein